MLARRTRISIETFHRGVETAPRAAELMGEVLGWSAQEVAREVEVPTLRASTAERRSQEQPDDKAADEVRTAAPDLLAGVTADA